MTWEEFLATALSLLAVLIARLFDQWVPPRVVPPTAVKGTTGPVPNADEIDIRDQPQPPEPQ